MLTAMHNRADMITRTAVVEPFTRRPVENARELINGFIAMVRPRGPQLAKASAPDMAQAALKAAVSPAPALVIFGQRVTKGNDVARMVDEAARHLVAGRTTVIHDGVRAVVVRPQTPVLKDGRQQRLVATVEAGNAGLRLPFEAATAGAKVEQRYNTVWDKVQAQEAVVKTVPPGRPAPVNTLQGWRRC